MEIKLLAIRIDAEIHKRLKGEALKQNLTLQQLLTYIVNEYLKTRK